MKINIRKNMWSVPFTIVNLFLLENMAKTYELSWTNDKIRLICYALLGILSIMFSVFYLIKHSGIVKRNSLGMTIISYLLILSFMLIFHSNLANDVSLLCTMIPFSLIMSYYGFSECYDIKKIVNIQCILFLVYWSLFMYNKLFLYQAGAGKLNSIFYLVLQLPFILSLQHMRWKRILISLLAIAVVISLKRTAVVIFVLALIIHLWIKDSADKMRVLKIITSLIVLAIITVIIQNKFNINIIDKFEMMADDGGSGRTDIYELLFFHKFLLGDLVVLL